MSVLDDVGAEGAVARDLVAALQRRGVDDVDDAVVTRAAYSTDASLYRVVPQAVARPRHADELAAIVDVARELRVPLTMRGAGTSIAGNAVGPGLVVDTLKHLNKVVAVDAEAGTAVVEPGTVHAVLQKAATAVGWRFGPDPSTHTRCTIGGMIGNNACGSRALGYGRMVDNVEGLAVVLGTGESLALSDAGAVGPGEGAVAALDRLAAGNLATIRTQFGRFGRQVSGYSLEHLLPENGRRVDRFLTGSEGTLGVITQATVRLVRDAPARTLAVLGYASMAEAADAVPALLAHPLVACEGLDARIVDLVRGAGKAVPDLPKGSGWLLAEVTGETLAETEAVLARVVADAQALDARIVLDPAEAAALWRIREDGAGLASRSLSRPAYSGWEDAAVPPAHLGSWLRDFDGLLREFGLDGVPYGHFGDGCVHVRIDFPLVDGAASLDEGRAVFRGFMEAAAATLATYGGSLSGEHGDGRARSELLHTMYDQTAIDLFAQAKSICDPLGVLNPGNITDPAPLDADLRASAGRHREPLPMLNFVHDGGSMGDAVHRCTGVGKCLVGGGAGTGSGVMCPSYAATRNEKDATRGRARVLQEALSGELVDGLADPAVHEALDLCLSCKGCANDCPTGIDMATYKSEALHQTYSGKRRPRSHYVLGRLPMWARLTSPVAGLANTSLKAGPIARVARAVAGVDQRRSLPSFASRTLRRSARSSDAAGTLRASTEQPDVWIWADSFTNHFLPGSGLAAIRFLESQGLRVRVIDERACCGLTWITTGQLDTARRIAGRTAATLAPYVASGVPVVGIEPSCTAALRSDLVELSDAPEAAAVADGVLTFGELLARLTADGRVTLPDLTGTTVVAQPHCHQASILGWEADERLLKSMGAVVTRVGGCCGLAGNFGVEKGHYEVSVAVAETQLLPAVRAARERDPSTVVLADGMSCKIQLDDLADVPALHLAELLASRV
ncbi:FAD-linked oxidase C-terminal domain-containing protein [Nocardioides zeae]|uniref:FAD-linked oxidase C-terminal domain-containing protein n=1 Tax=Nocardioides imazamoxiresistens TaxID=3231893 RepID=A0ABU3PS51_9ACTN|nr:FAD-linked oxidase C-terminal domain-containing protein [Nocardioides zeae]MDT9592024.1 FAD-linked oxidase C-terminal domain-containing protein [Nocardioides zeae]